MDHVVPELGDFALLAMSSDSGWVRAGQELDIYHMNGTRPKIVQKDGTPTPKAFQW